MERLQALGLALLRMGSTALVFAATYSIFTSGGTPQGYFHTFLTRGLPTGLVFGVVMGLVLPLMLKKKATITMPCPNRGAMIQLLTSELGRMNYQIGERIDTSLVFKPRARLAYKDAQIRVDFGPDTATLTGPALAVKQLEKKLAKAGALSASEEL